MFIKVWGHFCEVWCVIKLIQFSVYKSKSEHNSASSNNLQLGRKAIAVLNKEYVQGSFPKPVTFHICPGFGEILDENLDLHYDLTL